MPKITLQGPLRYRLRSLATSTAIATFVLAKRLVGRKTVRSWSYLFEYSTLFFRAQFNHAFRLSQDMAASRTYFDSLYGEFDTYPEVKAITNPPDAPNGCWYFPKTVRHEGVLLHFHGGGYAFHAAVSRHFARQLAHSLGMAVFAPDYRLTPEHPHPAQLDDALTAYRYLLAKGHTGRQIVLCGDSAGGHLALMTLSRLRQEGLPLPLLTLGISPWTDIGRRGDSQFGNDPFDLVQGYMTLQFADWLKGGKAWPDAELSPMGQDYRDLGPIYLQAGGREILVDMIRDFARQIAADGAAVRLDVWPDMNHEFHAYGDVLADSRAALQRLSAAIAHARQAALTFPADEFTECNTL